MAEVTHSSSSRMAGDAAADHILTTYGYSTNNAVVQIDDGTFDLYLDGQTILSNGDLVIATDNSKKLIFGTDSTKVAQFTTDGAFDLLSGKFLLNGTTGNPNQVLKTDGYGNLSWTDQLTQQHAFGGFSVSGQSDVTAGTTNDTITLTAGSGISLSTDASSKTITITSTAGGAASAFSTIVAGGQNIVGDSGSDTLTFVAGDNVTISSDTITDTITISASTSGETNQNAFATASVQGQNDITASSTSSTISFDSETNSSMDNRYAENRDKVTLETDTSTNKVKLKNNIPKTFSMASKVPLVSQTGENRGVPLRNKFYNISTSGLGISGGGANLGISTRALEFTNSSGTTTDILMPAKSDNSTLQLTITDSSGSTHVIDMDVAE